MKKLLVPICILILAGCSKGKLYTQELTGNWYTYQISLFNIQQGFPGDSVLNDSITFTADGRYTAIDFKRKLPSGLDTIRSSGRWQFQDSYGQLVLSDSANVPKYTFTILNLTGSSVELIRNGYDHYMRKNQ